MDNNVELINELNDFLKGINMGIDSFNSYKEKLQDENLKNQFSMILNVFGSQKQRVISLIDKLGGEVDDSIGLGGEIASIFGKMKDLLIDNDKEVIEHAINAMDMGAKQGDKVVAKLEEMYSDQYIIESLKTMVNEYREVCINLTKLNK